MGCLHEMSNFKHWFGNIHFSGPCNRSCYFCIGQHMMGLDMFNSLSTWPLKNLDKFIDKCIDKCVDDVYLTGTNTDPMLYKHLHKIIDALEEIGFHVGIRTNGSNVLDNLDVWNRFYESSLSIHSFDRDVYKKMMGKGEPPNLAKIIEKSKPHQTVTLNICISKINAHDIMNTINHALNCGIDRINIREIYGQPNYGNPLKDKEIASYIYGMPQYKIKGRLVTYWDVHYVEVDSVNLYASGKVSLTYPITRGYDDNLGLVQQQDEIKAVGRVRDQWLSYGDKD